MIFGLGVTGIGGRGNSFRNCPPHKSLISFKPLHKKIIKEHPHQGLPNIKFSKHISNSIFKLLGNMTLITGDPLLVVEDSNEDFNILHRLIRKMSVQNPIYRCASGDEALDYLKLEGIYQDVQAAPRPSVILLDLNLPGTDGRSILAKLKQDKTLKEIPVVIFTTSSASKDIDFCYQTGANAYLVKPLDRLSLKKTVESFVEFWLGTNVSPTHFSPQT
jgi:CheY-like chemotaxis protein